MRRLNIPPPESYGRVQQAQARSPQPLEVAIRAGGRRVNAIRMLSPEERLIGVDREPQISPSAF